MATSRAQQKEVVHLLLVDDSVDDRALAKLVLNRAFPGAAVEEVGDAVSFGRALERGGFDVAIVARELAWADAMTVLTAIRERWPQTPVVMLAGQTDERFAVDAMKRGLADLVPKSSTGFLTLPEVIDAALKRAGASERDVHKSRLESLLDESSIGVFRATLDGRLLEANSAFLRLFGKRSLEEAAELDLRGQLVPDFDAGEPSELFESSSEASPQTGWRRTKPEPSPRRIESSEPDSRSQAPGVKASGRLSRQVELPTSAGERRWLAVDEMIHLDAEGEMIVDGLVQDITATKILEGRLESSERAQPTGTELERFAAIAAHELREPVRSIETSSRLIAEKYAHRVAPEVAEYLAHVRDSARRLQKLLGNLFTLSRVESAEPAAERISCDEVVNEVLRELNPRIRAADAVVTVDPLPTVLGDRQHLEILFRNLVDNALKFRRDEPLRVRISAVQQDDEWVFSVRDNGLGIDPPGDEIFSLFTRLRPEIPGSGIGLAICKRVIEAHGGRLWVESEPGRGSRFRFTIPLSRGRRGVASRDRPGASQRAG